MDGEDAAEANCARYRIVQPWRATMPWDTESRDRSAAFAITAMFVVKKGSKIDAIRCGGMPRPVSLTTDTNLSSPFDSADTRFVIARRGVKGIEQRLRKTDELLCVAVIRGRLFELLLQLTPVM
jgi:hypothetical protein